MKLNTLLTLKPNQLSKLPFGIIAKSNSKGYQCQKVFFQPEILNLGVVLAGYYRTASKIKALLKLGDYLTIGHYLKTPDVLKFGTNFVENPKFKMLPSKQRTHLSQALLDETISLSRDLNQDKVTHQIKNLNEIQSHQPIYVYNEHTWSVFQNSQLNSLQTVIKQQLSSFN